MSGDRKIIKFITFNDTQTFEQWQIDCSQYIICSVIPIPEEVKMEENGSKITAGVTIKVFVTFYEKEAQ